MATKIVPIALVEPYEVLREGLKRILGRSRFRCAYECQSIFDLKEHAPANREIGAILIDIAEDTAVTVADLADVRRTYPLAKIILMSDPAHGRDAMGVGRSADGLVFRTWDADVILKAMELIVLGEPVFPMDVWQPLAVDPGEPERLPDEPPCLSESRPLRISPPPQGPPEAFERLSERELEVMRYLCNGDPNKIIARQLGISEATVKVHVKAILRKTKRRWSALSPAIWTKAKNRTEAALLMSAMTRSTGSH